MVAGSAASRFGVGKPHEVTEGMVEGESRSFFAKAAALFRRWLKRSRLLKQPRRERSKDKASSKPLQQKLRAAIAALVAVTIWLILSPQNLWKPVLYQVGDTFKSDIRAFRTFTYYSRTETEQRRREAEESVPIQYVPDPLVTRQMMAILSDTFERMRRFVQKPLPFETKVMRVKQGMVIKLPWDALATLMKADAPALSLMEDYTKKLLQEECRRGIKPEAKDLSLQRMRRALSALNLQSHYENAIAELLKTILRPNMKVDWEKTERRRLQARRQIPEVRRTIQAGTLIAHRGQVVTEKHLEMLEQMGLNYDDLIGMAVLALALTFGVALHLKMLLPQLYEKTSLLLLVVLIWLPWMVIFRGVAHWFNWQEFALPMTATSSMMTAILFNPSLAMFLSVLAGLVVGIITCSNISMFSFNTLELFILTITIGLCGAHAVASLRDRTQLIKAGVVVGLVCLTGMMVLEALGGELLIGTGTTIQELWHQLRSILGWSMLTGIISPAFTLVGVTSCERLFGISTVFTLLELSSPHAPALREFAEKAPGSYHSSLIVAKLAQEAASKIGANSLLAWVGGLYHDIGKAERPQYFVENQPPGANPHDHINPSLSALVIARHVDDGEQIARRYKLPAFIVEFIKEHHGTSLISYFYAKAKGSEAEGGEVQDIDYRYPGPKPRSKETTIVMLADSVEAAVRSLPEQSYEAIDEMVERVIEGKLRDGQLDESELTFHELKAVKSAFKEALKGIYHTRIEYPKPKELHPARLANGGDREKSEASNNGAQTHQSQHQRATPSTSHSSGSGQASGQAPAPSSPSRT